MSQKNSLPPDTDAATLFQLAQDRPDLWVDIIGHPNVYPDLLAWFEGMDNPEVQAALDKRNAPEDAPSFSDRIDLPPPAGLDAPVDLPPPDLPALDVPDLAVAEPVAPGPLTPEPLTPEAPAGSEAGAWVSPFQPRQSLTTEDSLPADLDELDDRTVLAKRRSKTLGELVISPSEVIPLTRQTVIIGRRLPEGIRGDADTVQAIELPDPTKTVSAVHAKLRFAEGMWIIEDLDSTNGIYLVDGDGNETELSGVQRVDGSFYLGDVLLSVRTTE